MRYLKLFFFSIMCSAVFAQETTPSEAVILGYIEERLPLVGTLKQLGDFVYLDLDDEYIHTLAALIEEEGFQEPPYFSAPYLAGAHISVAYSDELRSCGVKNIEELGMRIEFVPQKCLVVHPPHWQEIDQVYCVVVEAPLLDEIRERYGLPMRRYPFHITIGVKLKECAG